MARLSRLRLPLAIRLLATLGMLLFAAGLIILLLPQQVPPEALFAPPQPASDVQLTPQDRVLVLAPHPDDEVLGCGGIVQEAVAAHVPVRIVFLTYGDSNEWAFMVYSHRPVVPGHSAQHMGLVRHDEAVAADGALGLQPGDLRFLGYPDFGTLDIFTGHWGDRPPLRSILTRVTAVPYPNAVHPSAPYKGESILSDVEQQIREFQPTRIFVSHPADGNVDHRALYLYTRVALWDLEREGLHPIVYPYLVHWPRWPRPLGYHPDSIQTPPVPLKQQVEWHLAPLQGRFVGVKRQALAQHKSQMAYSANYLLAFVRQNELFSDLSILDMTKCSVPWHHSAPVSTPEVPSPVAPPITPSSAESNAALPCAEPSSLVGNEWRFVRLDDQKRLVLAIDEARPLAKETRASFYAFGYRNDRPFAGMPKLHVEVGPLGHSIDDEGARVSPNGFEETRQGRQITVKIPLAALGNPQKVLISSRTWLGTMSLDWNVWYEVDLP